MSTGIMAVLISNLYLSGQVGGDAGDDVDAVNKSMRGLASPTSLVKLSALSQNASVLGFPSHSVCVCVF